MVGTLNKFAGVTTSDSFLYLISTFLFNIKTKEFGAKFEKGEKNGGHF